MDLVFAEKKWKIHIDEEDGGRYLRVRRHSQMPLYNIPENSMYILPINNAFFGDCIQLIICCIINWFVSDNFFFSLQLSVG